MRNFIAEITLAILCLSCSAPLSSHAHAPAVGCIIAGSADPSVDGDLDGILLRVDDPKPTSATSERARMAPGPSERHEPAAAEIRRTPAGGETCSEPERSPDGAKEGKVRD